MHDFDQGSKTRQAVAAGLKTLCDWVVDIRYDDIPEEVMASAALELFDDIGAMVAARAEPELARLQNQLLDRKGTAEATIFRGGRPRHDRLTAATANGAASDWCELDEGYRVTSCHAGIYVLPALLAEAEATSMTIRDVLRVQRGAEARPQQAAKLRDGGVHGPETGLH